ncbi:hypothetical protein [Chryseobacterium muglaense]|uniref:Lipoprotein n=1 Tax=Chryseobacterium muglaense TaxID=2893752 RepID=A0ABR8MA87_9FLAO|nr:hypothetical protein [Chryseobacterium muglaense]MBD3907159.1 hypothetical protein [Chryseobacterium muglaense]
MKNILIYFTILFLFIVSCKGQDKDVKINDNQKAEIYSAKCQNEYSTGEKVSTRNKNWSLRKKDIDEIMKLSSEITENERHFSYPVTPCNIDVKNYSYKGKKYNMQINGGSYLSLFDGQKIIILGCDLPNCKKYFLRPKENMNEEEDSSLFQNNSNKSTATKNYKIDLNQNNIQDVLLVEKKDTGYTLKAQIDNQIIFNKTFECDFIEIETNTKNNQKFNLILEYADQYQKTFRKIVFPVFYKNNDLFIEKVFIATLGTNAKTGNEEWVNKEIIEKYLLKNIDVDSLILKS